MLGKFERDLTPPTPKPEAVSIKSASKTPQPSRRRAPPVPPHIIPRSKSIQRPSPAAKVPPLPIAPPAPPDYLAELRTKRALAQNRSTEQIKPLQWEETLQDDSISQTDRLRKIKADATRAEKLAVIAEASMKNLPIDTTLDSKERVDDIFIESIKAKLAVLQSIT